MDDACMRAFCIGELVQIFDGADRVERLCVAAADSLFHVQPLAITCHGTLIAKGCVD